MLPSETQYDDENDDVWYPGHTLVPGRRRSALRKLDINDTEPLPVNDSVPAECNLGIWLNSAYDRVNGGYTLA